MGICLQLVTSKSWSFWHDSITAKIPLAEKLSELTHTANDICDRTGELGGSNFKGPKFFTASNERGGVVVDTGVVEDQDLEWRS